MHLQYLQQHSRGRRHAGINLWFTVIFMLKFTVRKNKSDMTSHLWPEHQLYRPACRPDGWSTDPSAFSDH